MTRDNNHSPSRGRRRSGDIVDVAVDRRLNRPVRITCRGHLHHYEFAWQATKDGPVITDLRITSHNGAPITSDSVRRLNTVRLAHAAQLYDTNSAADLGRVLGAAAEASLASAMGDRDPAVRVAAVLAYIEEDDSGFGAEIAADMRRSSQAPDLSDLAPRIDEWWARRGESFIVRTDTLADVVAAEAVQRGLTPPPRRGGRPAMTREKLAQIAEWAREAVRMQEPYYSWIAKRHNKTYKWEPSKETIKVWIKRCKDPNDLLGTDALRRDELRQPRTLR
jgi:hypothetical protein